MPVMLSSSLLSLLYFSVGVCTAQAVRNPIYEAVDYTTKLRQSENGVLYEVNAPDATSLRTMHLFGSARERGVAHGTLLAQELLDFVLVDLPAFYVSQADQLPIDKLPEWLQGPVTKLLETAAPEAFNLALGWVYSVQEEFNGVSKANVYDEMDGIAEGICKTVTGPCDVAALSKTIRHVNMLPELIKMQCSMMGAWGPATPSGSLVQLRSLDFGGGPFANHNILIVNHPTDSDTAFAALSFPGMVAAVTGFSENIGFSEKVDDVSGGPNPAGTYEGQAVAMVIRDILQFAHTKEEAVQIAQTAKRTWGVWLGVGDYASQEFTAMLYQEVSAVAYDDHTLPSLTNQTEFEGVAYLDKHAQPSAHTDFPELIHTWYGNLTSDTIASVFPLAMKTGDVHLAVYDFEARRALLACGTTDEAGDFTRYAYESPLLAYDMMALWNEPHPAL